MATSKSTSRKGQSTSRSAGSSGSKRSGSRSSASKTKAGGSSRRKSSASTRARSSGSRSPQAQSRNGLVGTVKSVASKPSGPAVAVGAAAAGVVGGLVLNRRSRRTKVLGITMPRTLGRLPDLDVKSVAKTVGKASKQFGQTSKNVSKDIERVGDQAERIGKILG
jgi:hypothetical protein